MATWEKSYVYFHFLIHTDYTVLLLPPGNLFSLKLSLSNKALLLMINLRLLDPKPLAFKFFRVRSIKPQFIAQETPDAGCEAGFKLILRYAILL